MKKLFICMLLVFIPFFSGCENEEVPNEDIEKNISYLDKELLSSDYVFWYGRNHVIEDEVYFYYTATGFKISFTGRIIDFTLSLKEKNNDIYFSIGKDGVGLLDGEVIVLTDDIQDFRITFDTFDSHTLEVVKRSEPEDGITSLVKLETNGYFNKVEKDDDQLHFLLIGASGMSGHGALGSKDQARTTENSSSLHAFGYLTALRFDATSEFVAQSGWGLAFGFNDKTGEQNIFKAYDYIGIDQDEDIIDVLYDHQKIPDVVIVNIGGNDYSSVINQLTGFEKEAKIKVFKETVAAFIFKLRADAPEAHIIWTMTEGSQNGSAALSVINLLDENDKAYVHMVIINQVGEDGDPEGANHHASYLTHQKNADILEAVIRTYLDEL